MINNNNDNYDDDTSHLIVVGYGTNRIIHEALSKILNHIEG